MSLQGMVSSRDSIPDQKKANTENFVKELLEALTEIMDKKIHLENENLELKHKCQSQKQKIEAFKELALGEKAFLLGIIRKECCSACPGRQEEGDNAREKKTCNSVGCNAGGGPRSDQENQKESEPVSEIKNLQRIIEQHIEEEKRKEERLLSAMQQLEVQMTNLQKKCDGMQNQINDVQTEQKILKHKAKQRENKDSRESSKDGERNSLKSEEKESQTDTNAPKKVCRCGGGISQREEEILSELFFQRF